MRLGLVIYGGLDQRSGGYLYDRQLVKQLEHAGDQVEIISIPKHAYSRNLLDNLSGSLQVRLLQDGYDLLLQDELNHPSLFHLNRAISIPIVSIVHHLRSQEVHPAPLMPFYAWVEKRYLNTLSGAICNSETTAVSVRRIADIPIQVMRPGRDHIRPTLSQDEIRAKALETEPLRLLFLGNLIRRKGVHTLLSALASIPLSNWVLRVAGDEQVDRKYVKYLRDQTRQLGLVNNVRFLGAISPREVAYEMDAANLLVIPSEYEGYGIAYLEAMGYATVPVASSAGGAGEFVSHGENGYIVDPGDIEALSKIITAISSNREELHRLALSARRTYDQHTTWAEGAASVQMFLNEIMASNAHE
jgi:glycosyltransferase involved in cell wall biosynthesis